MKQYDLIYTDPAWSYGKDTGRGVAKNHYNTVSLEDIKSLPVNNLLKKDGLVYMWATFPLLKEAFEVIEAWDLTYVTVGFNWVKLNSNGTPFFGMGHHTRSNGEICLILKKGKGIKVHDNTISQIFLTKIEKHSKKPGGCYTCLEDLYGPVDRLEMFAREKERVGTHGEIKCPKVPKIY